MAELLRPNDLKQITIDAEMQKMEEERKLKQKKEQDQSELREAFFYRRWFHSRRSARFDLAAAGALAASALD